MYIRHNITALNTVRQLGSANKNVDKHTEKLATSLRINRAGDDVAGLSISEKLRAQISGLDKAAKNTQDSISLLQTAEGALSEVNDMIIRGRELAVQAASDTNTESDRKQLQNEYEQLLSEIDRVGTDTEFNTLKLFDGSTKSISLQLGANEKQGQDILLEEVSVEKLNLLNTALTPREKATAVIKKLDEAAESISSQRAKLGAYQNGFTHNISNLGQTGENLKSADSVIRDANVATEVMKLTKNEVLQETMQSALSHSNVKNDWVLNLLN